MRVVLVATVLLLVVCCCCAVDGAVLRLPGQKVRAGKGAKVLPSHKAFLNGAGGTYRNKVGGSIWPVSIFYTTIQVRCCSLCLSVSLSLLVWVGLTCVCRLGHRQKSFRLQLIQGRLR